MVLVSVAVWSDEDSESNEFIVVKLELEHGDDKLAIVFLSFMILAKMNSNKV
jgi:hypothetical protein